MLKIKNKFSLDFHVGMIMIAVIPVKLSERLPMKHLLPFNGTTIIEQVYHNVSEVFETIVYSKIELPVPYVKDDSDNIMELVYKLRREYGSFALIGGDMVFFTKRDLELLKSSFSGHCVVPRGPDGSIEPMFSIYSGIGEKTKNLREALISPETVYIGKERFSTGCFFNVNTEEDYTEAQEILKKGNF